MSSNFKVGQPVRTPDGRVGRILFFSNYAKPVNGYAEPTAAVVLRGRKGSLHNLIDLVAVELAEQPGISTEIVGHKAQVDDPIPDDCKQDGMRMCEFCQRSGNCVHEHEYLCKDMSDESQIQSTSS